MIRKLKRVSFDSLDDTELYNIILAGRILWFFSLIELSSLELPFLTQKAFNTFKELLFGGHGQNLMNFLVECIQTFKDFHPGGQGENPFNSPSYFDEE